MKGNDNFDSVGETGIKKSYKDSTELFKIGGPKEGND